MEGCFNLVAFPQVVMGQQLVRPNSSEPEAGSLMAERVHS